MISFVFIILAIWRILLFTTAWYGSLTLKFTPTFPYSEELLIRSGLPSWLWSFANFDGVHYLTIAKSGYSAQFTQVFFPLYPLLIKALSIIFPFFNLILVGLIISNLSFLLALLFFDRLLKLDYHPTKIKWMLIFFLLFPTSFFLGSLYTEAFFFLLVITSFYAARQKKWWLAGLLGGLAGATRLVGIFLLPALLWEWRKEKKVKNIIHLLYSPILYLIPLGLLAYIIYLQLKFGDWLYFWHAQPIFGAQRSGGGIILPPQVLFRYLKILFTLTPHNYKFWVSLSELLSSIVAIVLLIIASFQKIRPSYLIFSFLAVITPTLSGTFSSMPRYILVAFPIFMLLGLIESRLIKIVLLALSAFLLSIFTILFTTGYWIG